MNQPLTNAEKLYREAMVRLNDDGDMVDPFTLRRWLREAHASLDADPLDDEGQWQLWTVIGRCELRRAMTTKSGRGQAREHLEASLAAFQRAAEIRPTNATTAIDVGQLLGHLDRVAEAVPHFERVAAAFAPGSIENTTALLDLAVAHHTLDDARTANDLLRRATRQVPPDDARGLLRLAHVTAQLGHENDAAEIFARFLEASQGRDRGDDLAEDVIRRTPSDVILRAIRYKVLLDALVHVLQRADEPVPDDMAVSADRELSPEAWERFEELVGA